MIGYSGYVFSWNTIVMNETSEDRNACNVITLLRISISSRRKRPNICRHFLPIYLYMENSLALLIRFHNCHYVSEV